MANNMSESKRQARKAVVELMRLQPLVSEEVKRELQVTIMRLNKLIESNEKRHE